MIGAVAPASMPKTDEETRLHSLIDDARTTMEGELEEVRTRCQTYLHWYSPPFNTVINRHDAWEEVIDLNEDAGLTRSNFPICRAVVDIWTSLEAAKPPTIRAEPELVPPPMPVLDQGQAMANRLRYDSERKIESMKADIRSSMVRRWYRDDSFALTHHMAVKRKNLYGFAWSRIWPDMRRRIPRSTVLRNPTTVFPFWSSRDPDDLEALLSAQLMSAARANARWGLGLDFHSDGKRVRFPRGYDDGRYRDMNDLSYDQTRTMVWVEDYWWVERDRDEEVTSVHCVRRVCGKIVERYDYDDWHYIPFVYWQNTDERDSWGWSDIAGAIDINDEMNRRLSQEGDIIAMYASPRFQLLGGDDGTNVEMPDPFGLIPLSGTERIEQILTRIDVFPTQIHFQYLTEMLHRVTGLPPIVWGLIANAQTSGRALSASWKATETRLSPKLMANDRSLTRDLAIRVDLARAYDWRGARRVFEDNEGGLFDDWRRTFPPMEPRDYVEVTMDAITRRDAGLTTTVDAIRDTGEEDAESKWEAVKAEFADIDAHPDKVNAKLLAQRAQLDNIAMAQQLGQQVEGPVNTGTVMQAVGAARQAQAAGPAAAPPGVEGPMPPTQPGAPGNAGQPVPPGAPGAPGAPGESQLSSGTLVRNGEVSTQLLETRRF